MKIIRLSFLSFFLLCVIISSAQDYTERDGIGIIGGANFSDIVGRNSGGGNEPKLGLRAGFSLESTVMQNFYLRTELLYSQKGTRFSGGFTNQTAVTQTFHTLELPVMAGFEFIKGVGIGGGLYLDYLVNAEADFQFGGNSVPIEYNTDDLTRFGFGYLVELNFYDAGSNFQGGLRYQRNISTINNSIDRYHQVISAYVGILFNNAN